MTLDSEEELPCAAAAYGCQWRSASPLTLFHPIVVGESEPDIRVMAGTFPASIRPFHLADTRLRISGDGLRYLVDNGGVLDVCGTDRIVATPSQARNEALPAAFYGIATAALFALRGHLPIHGSAVALGDKGILICGHSGAGKSTLTAALVAAGGNLISDDLTVLQRGEGASPVLYAGRRAIRLFPDVAKMLEAAVAVERLTVESSPKVLTRPPVADPAVPYPLAAILMLSAVALPLTWPGAVALLLSEYGYRRRALCRLPGHTDRMELAKSVAVSVPAFALPPMEARDPTSFRRAAEDAIAISKGHV